MLLAKVFCSDQASPHNRVYAEHTQKFIGSGRSVNMLHLRVTREAGGRMHHPADLLDELTLAPDILDFGLGNAGAIDFAVKIGTEENEPFRIAVR
jgi:hypothetical protein